MSAGLALLVFAATSSAASRVELEASRVEACVTRETVEAALERASAAGVKSRVVLEPSGEARVRVEVSLEGPERSTTRRFEVRRRDCPLVPRLIARVERRFLADLPEPERPPLAPAAGLGAAWPERRWLWVEGAGAPAVAGEARFGARLALVLGPAGRPSWLLGVGYDVVPEIRVPPGRAELHAAWAMFGAGWETRVAGLPLLGTAALAGGAALARGRGFEDDRLSWLPVGRLRLGARVALPDFREGISPHVGVGSELSLFDFRLEGDPGASYREPLFRAELLLGLSWARTTW